MLITLRDVYRLTVFVPTEYLEQLLESIISVVPLRFGDYDEVLWFSAPGIEQFRPLPGANPTLGEAMKRTRHPSTKVEFSIDRDEQLLEKVIEDGIRPGHPWEEPVIFIAEMKIPLRSKLRP